MHSEIVVLTTLVALLGVSWLLLPWGNAGVKQHQPTPPRGRNTLRGSQDTLRQRQQAELDAFVRPYLLFSTTAPVAHC